MIYKTLQLQIQMKSKFNDYELSSYHDFVDFNY